MKSRITIDLDAFNRPIIQVEYNPSEDVRDKLVKRFLEGFAHESVWCRATVENVRNDGTLLTIRPLAPVELGQNAKEMAPKEPDNGFTELIINGIKQI